MLLFFFHSKRTRYVEITQHNSKKKKKKKKKQPKKQPKKPKKNKQTQNHFHRKVPDSVEVILRRPRQDLGHQQNTKVAVLELSRQHSLAGGIADNPHRLSNAPFWQT